MAMLGKPLAADEIAAIFKTKTMSGLNHPTNELYKIEPEWPDRCDKPNWLIVFMIFVSFLMGAIAGIGVAYLILN